MDGGVVGPIRGDHHRQARMGASFTATHFVVDWEQHQAPCAARRMSSSRTLAVDNRADAVITITPSAKDCRDSTKPAVRRPGTARGTARRSRALGDGRIRGGVSPTGRNRRDDLVWDSHPYPQIVRPISTRSNTRCPRCPTPVMIAPIVGYPPSRGGEAGMCPSTSAQTRSATAGRTWRVSVSWRVTTTPRRRSL